MTALMPQRAVCQACEHPLADHQMGWGRCESSNSETCVCPHAEVDDTETTARGN